MGSVPKLARQLSKRCRVVVFSGGSSTRIEDRSKSLRVYFFRELLIGDPVNSGIIPRMRAKFAGVLAKEKPDVVLNVKHLFNTSILVPYARRKGYPVFTATDTFPGYIWWTASPIANAVLWLAARTWGNYVLRSSEKVILYHEGLVPTAKKLGLRYTVIPNGVELELVRKAKPKKLAGRVNVLYVGRLESVKGYETIFAAMQEVAGKHPDVHFYHLGDNTGKEAFLARYRSKQFHIEGRQPIEQVYSYMKGADIIVLASRSEGLPNALMEGMACGCVPVSTPVGAAPALLGHGKLGRLFPYNDRGALAAAIEDLLANPAERRRMAAAGRKKIEKDYDWKRIIGRYLDALSKH